MKLKGKVVVIAGATGGIGNQVAKEFAKVGARLLLISHSQKKLDELTKSLVGEDHKHYLCDFQRTPDIEKCGEKISHAETQVDVLINAAGIGVYKAIEEVSLSEWEKSFAINVTAPYFLTKALLPKLKKSKQAVVMNLGSGMGKMPTAGRSVYCATKFALRGMTLSLSREFRKTNISFVHLNMGSVLTNFGPLTIKDKEEKSLAGKAYLTPSWVARELVLLIKRDEFEEEVDWYPVNYKERR